MHGLLELLGMTTFRAAAARSTVLVAMGLGAAACLPPATIPPRVSPIPVSPSDSMPPPSPLPQPTNGRLVRADDLAYQGSFVLPVDTGDPATSLAYGGAGLAYNPANESLFITGHDWFQKTAEVTIPTIGQAAEPGDLPRAAYLQAPTDASDGQLPNISDPPETEYDRVGGYLVDGDDLIVSAYHYYDAEGTQIRSHLLTDTNLGVASEMVSISPEISARWLGGAMAHVPAEWQAAFGGDPFIGGLGGISIASNSSVGPAAATFSRASLTGSDPAQLVLGYPLSAPLDGPETQSDLWNLTSQVKGIVFPNGTSSVLFLGSHGVGPYCYGTGEECGDPTQIYQGTHAAPYQYQVWAYDANDLASVYRGTQTPESLRPYDVWKLDLPYAATETGINGAAYDPATGRIFIAQALADGDQPVIHVYTLS